MTLCCMTLYPVFCTEQAQCHVCLHGLEFLEKSPPLYPVPGLYLLCLFTGEFCYSTQFQRGFAPSAVGRRRNVCFLPSSLSRGPCTRSTFILYFYFSRCRSRFCSALRAGEHASSLRFQAYESRSCLRSAADGRGSTAASAGLLAQLREEALPQGAGRVCGPGSASRPPPPGGPLWLPVRNGLFSRDVNLQIASAPRKTGGGSWGRREGEIKINEAFRTARGCIRLWRSNEKMGFCVRGVVYHAETYRTDDGRVDRQ